jgi:hypothetical protein
MGERAKTGGHFLSPRQVRGTHLPDNSLTNHTFPQGVIIMRTPIVMAAAVCGTLLATAAAAVPDIDPVLEWNSYMLSETATQPPFLQARYAAITQLAVFEAVNAIDHRFEPYLGTIGAPSGASAEAAAVEAAYHVLRNYFPADTSALQAESVTSLARIPDGQAKLDGIAAGDAAAAALIALRADDGWKPPEFYLPTSSAPGAWQPTPSCPIVPGTLLPGGTFLQWRDVRPFAIERADQFRSAPPPALTSERYARDYNEVKTVGSIDSSSLVRPPDRANVARFYAATAPVPVWNSVATQVAVAQGRSMSENARALALMNVAIVDASVSVFDTKYFYDFWRPETAIRAGGDATWRPFIVTPCFPSYGSAHGSLSNAARKVLERLYGPRHHSITLSNPNLAPPEVVLQYETFEQITHDISDARVYGGIHFRFDQEAGAEQGRQVGAYVYHHILQRVDGQLDYAEADRHD